MSAHSQKTFHVIDMSIARPLLTEAAGQSPPGFHEGRFFARIEAQVVVAKAEACVSTLQARMLAANGGNWNAFRERTKSGQKRLRTYLNTARFACVETAVLDAMRTMAEIEWDADRVRTQLFGEGGEFIRSRLCMYFRPPPMNDVTHLRAVGFYPLGPNGQLKLFPDEMDV